MHRTFACLSLFSLALGLGCQPSHTTTGPDGTTTTVTEEGDGVKVTVKGPGGNDMVIAGNDRGVALPSDFPKDVPVYPGATVVMASKNTSGFQVVLRTTDRITYVATFYEKKLGAQKWKLENIVSSGDGAFVSGTKPNRQVDVAVNETGGQTMVSLTTSDKAK